MTETTRTPGPAPVPVPGPVPAPGPAPAPVRRSVPRWLEQVAGTLDRVLRRPPLLHVAGDEGDGPPVVLVHGIASSSVTFQKLVPLLVGTHRVISIDILGFGRSPAPADAQYTIEEHVAALHRTIRSLRLGRPFVLVGHSLGSLIVSRYAAVHPEGLERLILVSPPIYDNPSSIGDRRVRGRVSAYLRAYDFLRANRDFTIRNARMVGALLPIRGLLQITETNWTPFVLSLEHCIESQTAVSDLSRVRIPVHVVYGTLDQFIAPGSLAVVEAMRMVTMHKVEGSDHIIRRRLARVIAAACG